MTAPISPFLHRFAAVALALLLIAAPKSTRAQDEQKVDISASDLMKYDTTAINGKVGQRLTIVLTNKGMLPKILEFGLQRGEKNRADITDALSIALMENLNTLERNLGVIGTIAVIAPFVGLFGTVLGIIRAFQDIALKGNSTPAVVAAGVSEALITTAAGLFVAVVSVIFFNYFKTRIKAYNQEMIVAANQLAEMLHFHNTGAAIPTDLYQPTATGAK